MSTSQFEPEVLALLDEIARSPEGRLLRVPRHKLSSYVGNPSETLTPHASYLSKAERHLVTAYREQAARVLLEACILRLKREPQVFTRMAPDEQDLRQKAKALSPRLSGDGGKVGALADGADSTATELAAASVRLAPTDVAFNALAVCYQKERWFKTSLRVLDRFFDAGTSDCSRAQAFSNMALVYSSQGSYGKAFELGSYASLLAKDRCRYAVWSMTDAIQAGDKDGAIRSAHLLEEGIDQDEYDCVMRLLREDKARGAWQPTTASKELMRRIRTTVPPVAEALCNVFS